MNRFVEMPPKPYKTWREYYLAELKLKKFQGAGNKCPNCNRNGMFGSIEKVLDIDGNWYLVCGYCQTIHKDLELSKANRKQKGDS